MIAITGLGADWLLQRFWQGLRRCAQDYVFARVWQSLLWAEIEPYRVAHFLCFSLDYLIWLSCQLLPGRNFFVGLAAFNQLWPPC